MKSKNKYLKALKNFRYKSGLTIISLILISSCIFTSSFAATTAVWQTTTSTSCPTQIDGSTMVEVGGYFYILGGTFRKYDPTTQTCTNLTSYPHSMNTAMNMEKIDNDTIMVFNVNGTISKYFISTDSWVTIAHLAKSKLAGEGPVSQAGATQGAGNAIVAKPGTNELYIIAGGGTGFQKYNPTTNAWTATSGGGSLAQLPGSISNGGAITIVGNTIYVIRGGSSTDFYKYDTTQIAPGSWVSSATTPASIAPLPLAADAGAALTTVGGNIYAFIGNNKKNFYKYCIQTDTLCTSTNIWVSLSTAPDFVYGGGALTNIGTTIYALQGNKTRNFWKYDTTTNTWNSGGTPAQVPEKVYAGGSLTSDGTYIYATKGGATNAFWRYCPLSSGTCSGGIAANTWDESIEVIPSTIGSSTVVTTAKGGMTYSSNLNGIYLVSGNGVNGTTLASTWALLHRYDVTGGTYPNTWVYHSAIPSTPGVPQTGTTLVYPGISASDPIGDFIYFLKGGANQTLWKLTRQDNSWIPWSRPILSNGRTITPTTPLSLNAGGPHKMVEVNSEFYISGFSGTTAFVKYNPTTNRYKQLADLPSNNGTGSLVKKDNNTLYFLVNTFIFRYDIPNDTWFAGFNQGIDDNGKGYSQDGLSQGSGSTLTEVNGKLYSIRGGGNTSLEEFDPITNTWITLANTPNTVLVGSAATKAGTDIYVLRGGSTRDFWKYDTLNNTWTTLTNFGGATSTTNEGVALIYPESGDYVYGLRGANTQEFWRYSISGNSWTQLANTPAAVRGGGSLVFDPGTTYDPLGNIYALGGNNSTNFWRYCLPESTTCTANTWYTSATTPAVAQIPNVVHSGGALINVGNNTLYALVGGETGLFYKYDAVTNSWIRMETAPFTAGDGVDTNSYKTLVYSPTLGDIFATPGDAATGTSSSTTEGLIYRYKLTSGTGQNTWRYSPALPITPSNISAGASLSYSSSDDLLYVLAGAGTSNFWIFDIANNEYHPFTKSLAPNGHPISQAGASQGSSASSILGLNGVFYVIPGNNTTFQKYNPTTNTWSNLTAFPESIGGAKMTLYDNDTIYILANVGIVTDRLWKYTISTDSFTVLANTPDSIQQGFAITYPGSGDYLYAFKGAATSVFLRYSISGNTWDDAGAADLPVTVQGGGFLVSVGGNVYGISSRDNSNNNGKRFWRYNIGSNTWTELANTPTTSPDTGFGAGASLVTDGSDIFATRGGNTSTLWKYCLSGNGCTAGTWSTLASGPANFGSTNQSSDLGSLGYLASANELYYIPSTGISGNNTACCASVGSPLLYRYRITNNDWPILAAAASLNVSGSNYIAYGCSQLTRKTINNYIYTFGYLSGNNCNTPVLLRYDKVNNTWSTLATPPASLDAGAYLVYDESNTLYATRGGARTDFWKYDIPGNTWNSGGTPTAPPINVGVNTSNSFTDTRGSLEFYNNDLWLAPGNSSCTNSITETNCSLLYRYNIASNSWPVLVTGNTSPATGGFGAGTDVASVNGTDIYILQGSTSTSNPNFWKYNIANESAGTAWSQLSSMPTIPAGSNADVQSGGALAYVGNNTIYATRGKASTDFQRYNISGNSWSNASTQQFPVTFGAASTTTDRGDLAYSSSLQKLYAIPATNTSATTVYLFDLNTRAAFQSINSGSSPVVNTPFNVVVQASDADGNPVNVSANTQITLSLASGTGVLGGTLTGTIPSGQSQVTISGVTYSVVETGVVLRATDTTNPPNIPVLVASNSNSFATIYPPPTISQISANNGTTAGGTSITITGTNFQQGATVTFGGNKALNVIFNNSTTLTVTTPQAAASGTVDVTVTNPDNQSITSSGSFTYNTAVLSSVTPSNGSLAGGTSVTLAGSHFARTRYRLPINITGTGTTLTNFQISFNINTSTLVSQTKMRSDCADLRVIDSDQISSLTYWIESGCNTATTKLWVKVPSIPASGEKTIYVTYGNNSFISESNGSNVFLFFDDFESGTINTSKWTATTGVPSISSGKLVLDAAEGVFAGNYAIPSDTVWESSADPQSGLRSGTPLRAATTTVTGFVTDPTANIVDLLWKSSGNLFAETNSGETSMGVFSTGLRRYKITYRPSNADSVLYDYNNGQLTTSRTGSNAAGTLFPTLYSSSGTSQYDWILIRQYAATEPTIGVNSEETQNLTVTFDASAATGVTFTNSTSITATTPAHAAGTINVTVTNPDGRTGVLNNGFTYSGPGDASRSTFSSSPGSITANGTATSTLTATIKDASDVLVPGKTVRVAANSGNPTLYAINCSDFSTTDNTVPIEAITNSNGEVCFRTSSTVAGTISFTAIDTTDAITISQQANVTFTPGALSASTSTFKTSPPAPPTLEVVANGTDTGTVIATLKDSFSNIISDATVSVGQISGSGSPTITAVTCASGGTAGTSNSSGEACFTVSSTIAGIKTFEATVNGTTTITEQASINFIVDTPSANTSTFKTSPPAPPTLEVVANGTDTGTIIATIKDASSNFIDGATVSAAQISGSGTPIISAVTCESGGLAGTSNSSGEVCFTVSATVAGTKTFEATINGTTTITEQATIDFIVGPPSASTSTFKTSPPAPPTLEVRANGLDTGTVIATIKDQSSNLISDLTVDVAKTSGNGTPTITAITCASGGTAGVSNSVGEACFNISSNTVSLATFEATIDETTTINEQTSINFVNTDPNPTLSRLSVSPSSVEIAGNSYNNITQYNSHFASLVVITLLDDSSNPLPDKTVDINISAGPGTITKNYVNCSNPEESGTNTSDANGKVCAVVSNTATAIKTVSAVVTSSDPDITLTQTANITFNAVTSYNSVYAYRFRNDDGTESSATNDLNQNNPYYNAISTTPTRLRFGIKNNNTNVSKFIKNNLTSLDAANGSQKFALIDQTNAYVYFGATVDATTLKINRYNTGNLNIENSLNIAGSENENIHTGFIDYSTNKAYFVISSDDNSTNARIISVNLSTFTNESSVDLGITDTIYSSILDSANGFAYLGTYSSPGKILKIKLDDLSIVGTLTLGNNENNLNSAIVDTTNKLAYFSTSANPSTIIKVDLNVGANLPPNKVASLVLTAADDAPGTNSAVIDTINGYAYYGTNTNPAKILKIDINPNRSFAKTASLTLADKRNIRGQAIIDAYNGFAYFISTIPGVSTSTKLVKINLSTFTHNSALDTLSFVDENGTASVFADKKGYAYYASESAAIHEIKLSTYLNLELQVAPKGNNASCSAIEEGSWQKISNSNIWQMNNSSNINDGNSTTNVPSLISDGNRFFREGQMKDVSDTISELNLGENQFTEIEYSLISNNSARGTYCFRLQNKQSQVSGLIPGLTNSVYAEISFDGLIMNKTAVTLIEGTTTDSYTVRLAKQPSDEVAVTLTSSGDQATISPENLIFTTENWNTPQTINISSARDSTLEGIITESIRHTVASSDDAYNGISSRDISATITDYGTSRTNTSVNVSGNISMTVPSSFTFNSITTGQDTATFYTPAINNKLSVTDSRTGPGFTVTVQASAFNGSGGNFIPLQIFKVGTTNFTTNPSDPNITAPLTINNPNNNNAYINNFGTDQTPGAPLVILNGTTGPHNTTASLNVNYLLDYSDNNIAPPAGIYNTTVTFTLNPNP